MKKILVLVAAICAMTAPEWQNAQCAGSLVVSQIGTAVTQNFNSLGTSGTSVAGLDNGGWGFSATSLWANRTNTMLAQSTALTSSSSGNYYNFGTTADRAIGILNSGSFSSPRSIMLRISNQTGTTITELNVQFAYEKYRSGTRAFNMAFSHGADGTFWTTAADGGQSFAADASNATAGSPLTSADKQVTLSGLSIANNTEYFLRWTLTGVGGSTNGQAIGIDDLSVTAVPEPSALLLVGSVLGAGFLRRRRS